MSKLIRTDLPDEVWAELNAMAQQAGVKIGVYVKRLLIEHAAPDATVAYDPNNPDQWKQLVRWCTDNRDTWATFTGDRNTAKPEVRRAVYTFAAEHGFTL